MKKNSQPMLSRWFLLLILVLLSGLIVSCGKPEPAPEPVSFTAQIDGGAFHSEQMKGKVIYLDFWASWCVPCRESFPWMNDMLDKYSDQGLVVLGVSLDQDKGLAKQFAEEFNAQFIIGFDHDGKLADQFGVKGLPSSVLIDRDGNLLGTHTGFNEEQAVEFEASIVKALKS